MSRVPPPPRPVRWSFETDLGQGFEVSSQRFDTKPEAFTAMVEWMTVCADNSFYPAARLTTRDPVQQ